MLETIRDDKGEIRAVCEWYIVDSQGHFDVSGEYVWVEQFEFSNSVNGDGHGYIKEFIGRIINLVPHCKFGYFRRNKYKGRVRLYTKSRWLKFVNGGKQ